MAAAVDLQQQALACHPLTAAAVTWWSSATNGLDARLGQDPAQAADR